jgi:uncharacterized protein (DUF924 family)
MQLQPILHFWFEELTAKQHFVKDAALDETIRARFGGMLDALWAKKANDRLTANGTVKSRPLPCPT